VVGALRDASGKQIKSVGGGPSPTRAPTTSPPGPSLTRAPTSSPPGLSPTKAPTSSPPGPPPTKAPTAATNGGSCDNAFDSCSDSNPCCSGYYSKKYFFHGWLCGYAIRGLRGGGGEVNEA